MAGLQGLPDLASLEGLSPYLNQAGTQQIRDAQAFNQVGLQQNQASLEEQTLKNLFQRQNDPLLLDQQRLVNEGKTFENMSKGVTARTDVALEGESREAKRAKLLNEANESDLNRLLAQAQIDLQSDDPNVKKRGQLKMDSSWKEIERRAKHKDDMEKSTAEIAGRANVANIQSAASRYTSDNSLKIARERASAKSGQAADLLNSIKAGKIKAPAELASAYNTLAFFSEDPAEQARFMELARTNEQLARTAVPASGSAAGKIDVPAVANLPRQNVPSALGGQPAPAAAPKLTLGEVQKMYPGRSAEELKNVWKKKFGVDLQ